MKKYTWGRDGISTLEKAWIDRDGPVERTALRGEEAGVLSAEGSRNGEARVAGRQCAWGGGQGEVKRSAEAGSCWALRAVERTWPS